MPGTNVLTTTWKRHSGWVLVRDVLTMGTLPDHAVQFLDASVTAGLNIVVASGTQACNPTMRRDSLGDLEPSS